MKKLELYIHIPFCVRKCAYCDFLSFASIEQDRINYVDALLNEIESYRDLGKECQVSTIFIGGGTPSVLEPGLMEQIMGKIQEIFSVEGNAEITIEVNPGTVSEEKISMYTKVGINRVSIGLQATNNEELAMLGRIHTYEEFLETYQMIYEQGIHNINIDLISAIPKQTVESWTKTMDQVLALNPTHISAYSLIIEEGTLFHDKYEEYEHLLPEEEAEREMYHLTKTKLEEAGYFRYEISNYAKAGYECKHNLGYWERVNYLGVGLGASSCIENVRWSNEKDMNVYINLCENGESCILEKEELSQQAKMEEFMFLGLRKMEGVSKQEFCNEFGVEIEAVYGEILDSLKEKGLLIEENKEEIIWIKLTELGIDVSNQVMVEFLE